MKYTVDIFMPARPVTPLNKHSYSSRSQTCNKEHIPFFFGTFVTSHQHPDTLNNLQIPKCAVSASGYICNATASPTRGTFPAGAGSRECLCNRVLISCGLGLREERRGCVGSIDRLVCNGMKGISPDTEGELEREGREVSAAHEVGIGGLCRAETMGEKRKDLMV